jgi:DNA replication protein DnaC
MELTVGSQQQITIAGNMVSALVKSVDAVPGGAFVIYNIPNYGETQPFWSTDGTVQGIETRRSQSMIPPEYVYKRAKDFQWDIYGENVNLQRQIVNAFIVNFKAFEKQGRGLYIYSETKGSGKTMLACCLCNEVIERYGIPVKFISVPDFVELIKDKSDMSKEKTESLYQARLLVLDDIGAQTGKQEWIDNALFRLIDYRKREFLPTIFTSNCDSEQLKMDDRSVDRIVSISTEVKIPERSIRREKAAEANRKFIQGLLDAEKP